MSSSSSPPKPRILETTFTRSRTTSQSHSHPHSRARSPGPTSLRNVSSFTTLRRPSKSKPASPTRSEQVALPSAPHTPPPVPPVPPIPIDTTALGLSTQQHLSASAPEGSGVVLSGLMSSAASSVSGVNMSGIGNEGEGMIATEPETDIDEVEAVGRIEEPGLQDREEARRTLRDQLRRTLTQTQSQRRVQTVGENTRILSPKASGKQPLHEVEEIDVQSPITPFTPRQYFVLTSAGKPVFCSSPLNEDSDALSSTMGLMQALISVFLDDGDKLRHINAGKTRINFLLRGPVYLCCVSNWGEPESVTRSHLEYLHLQILSIVSGAQLKKIFERRTNFDLRRLLDGTETFLHLLLSRLETDLAISTSSLACLPLDSSVRSKAASALIPHKMKDILYVLLVARGMVITLVRPKKHSVHPSDLHILLNTIHAPAVFESPASWIPICLPRYNANGFLNAYVSFPRHGEALVPEIEHTVSSVPHKADNVSSQDGVADPAPDAMESHERVQFPTSTKPSPTNEINVPDEHSVQRESTPEVSAVNPEATPPAPSNAQTSPEMLQTSTPDAKSPSPGPHPREGDSLKGQVGLGIVVLSGGGDFETIRAWCDNVTKTLESNKTLDAITNSIRSSHSQYTASSLGIPGLWHFVYKSRSHVQVTYPVWADEYEDIEARRRLVTFYQGMHDAIHGKSGQAQSDIVKLRWTKTTRESVLGWITQTFELYIAVSPRLPKSAVINAANAVAKWVKKEEGRLFLRDAPVF